MHKKDYLKLKSFSSVTQEVNDPFYAIVRAADIIIVDGKSGAAPEVMLIDESKPIVLLNRVPGGWHLNEMLDIGPIVTNPEDLMNSISSMLAQDEFSKSRALLKKKIYADNYGNAGDIAAQAIIDLSKLPKISGPLKKKIRRHYAWYSKLGRSCLKRMNRYLGTNFKIRDINDIMHFY